ncbi:MAG: ATP-dependent DNA ligase [Nanoarchaeota archaeon]|nr:ATP-dependent DNA ligase [Nanoarchaeota archaeon]
MKYSKLVEVYENLESDNKKLGKRDIIAELLKETSSDDLSKVVLLISGKIFPRWSEEKTGVASQLMIKAISKSTGIGTNEIIKRFNKTGDLGKVAEELIKNKKQKTLIKKVLTIDKVFENLQRIAKEEGKDSQKRKQNLISELLSQAEPVEAKYIVKIVLEELRIGVAEGKIRDAIGLAFNVDPKDVENAWFLEPDYGKVAEIAKRGGLSKVKAEFGIPLIPLLAIKSPSLEQALIDAKEPAIEVKFDGMRCITGFTPIYVKDKGMISVKDVKIGDHVLTHSGNFNKVLAKNKRTIDRGEGVYKLQSFFGEEFNITEDHKILIKRGTKEMWMPVKDVIKSDKLVFPIPKMKIDKKVPKMIKLKTIDNYEKEFKLNENFFRFIGYWIGDGFSNTYNKTHRIGILFNSKTERKLCDFYKNLIKKEFKITNISEYIHSNCISLYWTDREFLKWLSKNFRIFSRKRGWRGKSLPFWFWNITKTQFKEFLKGWIESDGHVDKIGRTSITTKERFLATFAHLMALKFKIKIGVKKVRIDNKTYYKMIIAKSEKHMNITKNKVYVRINRIEKLKKPDPRTVVYNIEVDKDKTYCTPMVTLHNSQIHKKGNKIMIYTRRQENVTKAFPDVIELCKNIKCKECIIEGEILAMDSKTKKPMPFQKLSQRIKRKHDIQKTIKEVPVQVKLFDLMYLDGKLLFDKTLRERRAALEKIINEVPKKFELSKMLITKDLKKAEKFYKEALNAGQEGVMVKNLNATYQPERHVGFWWKVKPTMETLDLVVVGGVWGAGKRAGWIGSYILACKDDGKFLECGMLGSGLKEKKTNDDDITMEELTKLLKPFIEKDTGTEIKIKPKLVIETAYEEIQMSPKYNSGFALRFPRVVRIRIDKGPEDADSLNRIKKLYTVQKGKN